RCASVSAHASSLRLATVTLAPADTRPSAMARPMPRVPPVTIATRSVRSNSDSSFLRSIVILRLPKGARVRCRPVDATDYLRTLDADAHALADAARKGIDAPVPSCPDWKVADLVDHIARVHRWATQIVRDQVAERVAYPEPPSGVDILGWYSEGVGGLLDTLRSADPNSPAWNFTGGPQVAAFWQRRQALETAVHRWDAQ